LRIKSNVELHQLWYILLKERNMLLTVKQDALREQRNFPSPDRLRKVRNSMRGIKVVIGERERAAAEAAETDGEKWSELRADVEVETGIRKQVGSEKKGKVARKPPNAGLVIPEQTDAQHAQLLGVDRPGLAAPGQPQRPMTKPERSKFRRELQEARSAVVAAKVLMVVEEMDAISDEELRAVVLEAEAELLLGWEPDELDQRHLVALHEAYARGVETFFQPRELTDTASGDSVARAQHGITRRKGKVPQKWAYTPVDEFDWQSYVQRYNVRVTAEKTAAE
jgi:hypothetical protein